MTEELEKEAEEKYGEVDREFIACQDEGEIFNIGYVLGAEPREKQIQIDAEQIRALQKQKGELTDKVAELKKQLGNLYEIIKRPYQFTAPRKIQIVEEAEQFLKEEQNVFNQ